MANRPSLTQGYAKEITEKLRGILLCISQLHKDETLQYLEGVASDVILNDNFLTNSNELYLGDTAICRLSIALLYFESKTLVERMYSKGLIEVGCAWKIFEYSEGNISPPNGRNIRRMLSEITGDKYNTELARKNRRNRFAKLELQRKKIKQEMLFNYSNQETQRPSANQGPSEGSTKKTASTSSSKKEDQETSTNQAFDVVDDHYAVFLTLAQLQPRALTSNDEDVWIQIADMLNKLDIGTTTQHIWKEKMQKWISDVKNKDRKREQLDEKGNKLLILLKKHAKDSGVSRSSRTSNDEVDRRVSKDTKAPNTTTHVRHEATKRKTDGEFGQPSTKKPTNPGGNTLNQRQSCTTETPGKPPLLPNLQIFLNFLESNFNVEPTDQVSNNRVQEIKQMLEVGFLNLTNTLKGMLQSTNGHSKIESQVRCATQTADPSGFIMRSRTTSNKRNNLSFQDFRPQQPHRHCTNATSSTITELQPLFNEMSREIDRLRNNFDPLLSEITEINRMLEGSGHSLYEIISFFSRFYSNKEL